MVNRVDLQAIRDRCPVVVLRNENPVISEEKLHAFEEIMRVGDMRQDVAGGDDFRRLPEVSQDIFRNFPGEEFLPGGKTLLPAFASLIGRLYCRFLTSALGKAESSVPSFAPISTTRSRCTAMA